MLKQIETEQRKVKLFRARMERLACAQIIRVLAHMDRLAIMRIFNRWLFFHASSPRKPGTPIAVAKQEPAPRPLIFHVRGAPDPITEAKEPAYEPGVPIPAPEQSQHGHR